VTDSHRKNTLAIAILIAVPAALFLDVLLGSGVFYVHDVAFYHFPGRKILHDIILGGELPYWNPFLSAGQPLAANPAYEVFYPLTWLIFLPSFLYGFQLLALSHVFLATFSMYALLRSLGATRAAALIGGLSFGLGGLVLSCLHLFPFLFSTAWLPLTCLFTRRFLLSRARCDFVLAASMLAMQFLIGEPVTILQTAIILGLYVLFSGEGRAARRLRDLALLGAISIAAVLLSAVQTLPTLDHYRDSVRNQGFTLELAGDWSTPPLRFAETVYPSLMGMARPDSSEPYWGPRPFGQRPEPYFWSIYSGLLIVSMVIAGLVVGVRGRWLYLSICTASVLLAIGTYTPLFGFLYRAGVTRSIRYPEKFAIMGVFATVVFGALTFDALLLGERRIRKVAFTFAAASALFAALAVTLTYAPHAAEMFHAIWRTAPDAAVRESLASSRTGWLAATARGLLLAVLIVAMPRVRRGLAMALAGIFVVADLGMFVPEIAPRAPPAFYTDPPLIVRELAPDRDAYRIFQLDEWMANVPNRAAYTRRQPHAFLLLRNGLFGLSTATYGFRGAMEIDYDLTSLTVTDNFERAAWALRKKTLDWLPYVAAMSNIRYVSLFRPIEPEIARTGGDARYIRPTRVIQGNLNPRYYFAPRVVPSANFADFVGKVASGRYPRQTAFVDAPAFNPAFIPAAGRVLRWKETANTARIDVDTAGPAFLVLSVTAHKYWRITVDDREVPALLTNLTYQGVVVPPGRHVVAMVYRNPLIPAGAAISMATLLGLFLATRAKKPRRSAILPAASPCLFTK
jgi:hypothetical protein